MLLYDHRGDLVPPGSLHRVLTTGGDYAFEGGTLPEWLALGTTGNDAGATLMASPEAPGGVRLTTAAATNARATLYGPPLDLTKIEAARLTVAYTGGSQIGVARFAFGFADGVNGGYAAATGVQFTLIALNAGAVTSQAVHVEDDEAAKRYRFNLTITPADGGVYIGEGDDISAHREFGAAMSLGTVTPYVQFQTLNGQALVRDVHEITLERWWR